MIILQKAFTQNKDKAHTHVICGLGGCGKTTISIEYAWLFQGLYPGGVFWMSAESDEAIEDTVSILANDINIQGANTKEVLKAALKWLSLLTKRWLLIVDNADAESLTINMKELMFGIWKRKTLGHIIITTRREPTEVEESLNVKEENCINLQMLSVEEGFEFMTKRSGRVCDEREFVFKLFEELGGLPLALEQAAAHIKSIKCSFEDYYKRFMKKRLNLLVKPAKLPFSVEDVRMVVTTTWQINMDFVRKQSHEEGLGTAAESVMKIASFLFADDIPIQIFNNGEPVINETDINDVMSDSVGVQQCIEILTRFSLFQRHRADSLSIHRLVQEVIRNNVISDLERKQILQHAVKMINKALRSNPSPTSILRRRRKGAVSRGSLTLWNKLAMNANALKLHLWNFSSDKTTLKQVSKDFYLDKPTAYLIHTVAVYHSLLQRQDEALENQKQLLQMIASLNLDEDAYEELTSLKIPLLEKDKIHIQNCIASVLSDNECTGDVNQTALVPLSSEKLRMLGNAAYYEKRFEDALQYYTEALRAFSEAKAKIDHKVLSNRSLVNLKLNNYQQALDDANKCLEINPESWKGHAWKAYAIAYLIEEKILQREMIGAGLCSASFAGYLNEKCLLEYEMKIYYPLITYKFVETPDMLKNDIISLTDRLFTTYMLRKGTYSLKDIVASTKSLQLFGVEEGVIINVDKGIHILRLPDSAFDIQFEQEPEINFHFENISFKSEGQILVKKDATATFYRCKFSNGTIPCKPVFNNPDTFYTKIQGFLSNEIKSEYGAISAVNGGKVTINSCQIDGCKGCGVVACRQAVLNISNSTICNAGLIGICVETGSSLTASNNDIIKNELHGIAIGKNAIGYIQGNNIESNKGEGVWFGRVLSLEEVEFTFLDNSGSNAVIANNTICRNGLSGICLEGGYCEIKDNTISDNCAWGILVQNNTSVFISNNEISGNRCGGVRDGVTYSSSLVLDGNTIRNHSGPGFYAVTDYTWEDEVLEKKKYSLRPIITNRNYMYNNNKEVQITKEEVFLQLCCFCNKISSQLKFCSKCRIAQYCSKDCQTKHWLTHKNICALFTKGYTIEINLQDTKPIHEVVEEIYHHHFQPNIVSNYDGAAPDKGNSKRFKVKIISDHLYGPINPGKSLTLYDRSLTIDIIFTNPKLYHLCSECGKLTSSKLTAKEICCSASYKDNGRILCIYTNNLLPFEEW